MALALFSRFVSFACTTTAPVLLYSNSIFGCGHGRVLLRNSWPNIMPNTGKGTRGSKHASRLDSLGKVKTEVDVPNCNSESDVVFVYCVLVD